MTSSYDEIDSTSPSQTPKFIRMLEFFSGIGGMKCALDQALERHQAHHDDDRVTLSSSSCAYEINREANRVYEINFPNCRVVTKLVEQLTVRQVQDYDLWTMSPPCQPFTNTRFAKQADLDDPRTKGFLALLKLLRDLESSQRPTYFFLENVQGFAKSRARICLLETLADCGYQWTKEYLVSPIQLGIPNHRKRYYMLARRTSIDSTAAVRAVSSPTRISNDEENTSTTPKPTTETIHTSFLPEAAAAAGFPLQSPTNTEDPKPLVQHTVGEYLDAPTNDVDDDYSRYNFLSNDTLTKDWAPDLPLVGRDDTQSHCFTAFYSRQFHKTTGSLVVTTVDRAAHVDRTQLTNYRIRPWTPTELLRLFGFVSNKTRSEEDNSSNKVPSFLFPPDIKLQTQYKLIGNSINVTVVSILLYELLDLATTESPSGSTPISNTDTTQQRNKDQVVGRIRTGASSTFLLFLLLVAIVSCKAQAASPSLSNTMKLGPIQLWQKASSTKFQWSAHVNQTTGLAGSLETSTVPSDSPLHCQIVETDQKNLLMGLSKQLFIRYPSWLCQGKVTLGLLQAVPRTSGHIKLQARLVGWTLLEFGPPKGRQFSYKTTRMRNNQPLTEQITTCQWSLPITGGCLTVPFGAYSASKLPAKGEVRLTLKQTNLSSNQHDNKENPHMQLQTELIDYRPHVVGAALPSNPLRTGFYLGTQSTVHAFVMWRFHGACRSIYSNVYGNSKGSQT